jgi:hypothetical protein
MDYTIWVIWASIRKTVLRREQIKEQSTLSLAIKYIEYIEFNFFLFVAAINCVSGQEHVFVIISGHLLSKISEQVSDMINRQMNDTLHCCFHS